MGWSKHEDWALEATYHGEGYEPPRVEKVELDVVGGRLYAIVVFSDGTREPVDITDANVCAGIAGVVEDARAAKELFIKAYGEDKYREAMGKIEENVNRLKQEFPHKSDMEVALAVAKVKLREGEELGYALYKLWVLEQLEVL